MDALPQDDFDQDDFGQDDAALFENRDWSVLADGEWPPHHSFSDRCSGHSQ
jgi:hypothetical protein